MVCIGEGEENLSVKKVLLPFSHPFPVLSQDFLLVGGAARREFRWMRECFYG